MSKKHLEDMEVREVVGQMEKDKFIATAGKRVKNGQVKDLTPEELNRANKEKDTQEKEIEQ